jgi:putative membrane protein
MIRAEIPAPEPPRPRDRTTNHLANERTFLAWVRTALGLIGLGFVLARMGLFLRQLAAVSGVHQAHGLKTGHEFLMAGVVFLVLGTLLCGWSGWRYDRARLAIDVDRFEPARHSIAALTAIVVLGGLAIVALVVWGTLARGGL